MSRIPTHTIADAPESSRPLLQKIVQSSPGGRLLNLHAQLAHSPGVLTAYTALRAAISEHGAFEPKLGAALNLAVAGAVGNEYFVGIASRLAAMNGWNEGQIAALRTGKTTGDAKLDALTVLVREATAQSGKVNDATWKAALQAGWTDRQLTDSFAQLGAVLFTAYFLNFAQTSPDA